MSRYRRTRDGNEAAIVDALRAMGCSVARLDGRDGIPDLLVGYTCPHGVRMNLLIEVKNPATTSRAGNSDQYIPRSEFNAGGKYAGICAGLDRRQAEWHLHWLGDRPFVSYNTVQAIECVESQSRAVCEQCACSARTLIEVLDVPVAK